ncbi:MAG: hypothetical protein ABS75_32915 [Pelagibacterium sp. SCN 63-23]|nr:MAG: hypothetical protein ABS75_32915 [Pelagibacterium sp. SCN 63-23]
MKKLFIALSFGLLINPANAHQFSTTTMVIDHPAIQEAPPNAPVLGGYATFSNNGAEDDRLLAIESPAVTKVELHQSVVTDGVARMTPMDDGLAIPAGTSVWLGDDGTHAMFIGPDRRYVAGDEISATLVFEKAGRVEVVFNVEKGTREDIGRTHDGH